MSYSTGLHWLHNGSGLVSAGVNLYGGTGHVKTEAELESDINDNKAARIDITNASGATIRPLIGTVGTGNSGTTSALLECYGVIGFGEPTQNDYIEKEKYVIKLGTIVICTVTDGQPDAVSTQAVHTNPSNYTFSGHTGGGTGADVSNDIFGMIPSYASTVADLNNSHIANQHVGLANLIGLDAFTELLISFYVGSLGTDATANGLINLYY